MRIVPQSAADFYSPFYRSPYPLLEAPRIAGYLPPPPANADRPPTDSRGTTFTYSNAAFADLPDTRRADLFAAARILLDVAAEYLRGTLNDHAVNTAIMVYRQAIAQSPIVARNPAEFNALIDAPLLQYMIASARQQPTATDGSADGQADRE